MKYIHPDDTHPCKEITAHIFYEVVLGDVYGVRDFARRRGDEVKAVVDVGANVGYFSILASCLFPSALRIAVEPARLTHELLMENVNGWGVKCVREAIGDGHRAKLVSDVRVCGSDRMVPDPNGAYTTMRLSEILRRWRVPKTNWLLKVDCEGGEKFLLDDTGLDEWLPGCLYLAAEFHESASNPKAPWNEWLTKRFGKVESRHLGTDHTGDELYADRAENGGQT